MSEFILLSNGFGKQTLVRKKAITAVEEFGDRTRIYVQDFCFTSQKSFKELMEELYEEHRSEK